MVQSMPYEINAVPTAYAKEHYLFVRKIGQASSEQPFSRIYHTHDSFLFFLVLEGRGAFHYNQQSFSLRQGHCVWIDCRLPFSYENLSEYPLNIKWVSFQGTHAAEFFRHFFDQGHSVCFSPDHPGSFNETLSLLMALQQSEHSHKDLLSHKHLTDIITLCFTENTRREPESAKAAEKLLSIRNYLAAHFSEEITLETLSRQFYMSRFYLSREYKKSFGATIGTELTAFRISSAKERLRFSTDSLSEIADQCGFSDPGYFSKVFKKTEGITPLEYRRKW